MRLCYGNQLVPLLSSTLCLLCLPRYFWIGGGCTLRGNDGISKLLKEAQEPELEGGKKNLRREGTSEMTEDECLVIVVGGVWHRVILQEYFSMISLFEIFVAVCYTSFRQIAYQSDPSIVTDIIRTAERSFSRFASSASLYLQNSCSSWASSMHHGIRQWAHAGNLKTPSWKVFAF